MRWVVWRRSGLDVFELAPQEGALVANVPANHPDVEHLDLGAGRRRARAQGCFQNDADALLCGDPAPEHEGVAEQHDALDTGRLGSREFGNCRLKPTCFADDRAAIIWWCSSDFSAPGTQAPTK